MDILSLENGARMILTFGTYLVRQFLMIFGIMLFGLAALLSVFDILANADTILEHQSRILAPIFSYMGLRLPQIFSLLVPMAALLSSAILLGRMVANQEIIAMRSIGLPVYVIGACLMTGGVLIASAHFIFANTVLPKSSAYLNSWSAQDYKGSPGDIRLGADARGWFSSEGQLISVDFASADGRILYNVHVIERDENALIDRIITARTARYDGDEWVLSGENAGSIKLNFMPDVFTAMHETESEVSYGQLAAILDAGMVEAGIENQYKAWFHYKLARPLSVFLMVLIAMPMALQISRRGSILSVGFGIVLAGFAYFILESLFLSLAETGTFPALLAVWSPPALTLLVSSWLILLLEG